MGNRDAIKGGVNSFDRQAHLIKKKISPLSKCLFVIVSSFSGALYFNPVRDRQKSVFFSQID